MSWEKLLKDASYKGMTFEVKSTLDPFSKSLGIAEFAYKDGGDVQDMGMHVRRVQLPAIFRGDNYEAALNQFIALLSEPGGGVLVHPVFGPLENMVAQEWPVRHDADMADYCEVSLTFVQDSASAPLFAQVTGVTAADSVVTSVDAARQASAAAVTNTATKVAASGMLARLSAFRRACDEAKNKLRALLDTSGIRAVLADLDPLVYPKAWISDVESIADIALQGLPFGGRNILFSGPASAIVAGDGLADFNTISSAAQPSGQVVSADSGASDAVIADTATISVHAQVLAASSIAEAASIVLAGEIDQALLSRQDVERVASVTRTALQAAMDAARASLDAESRAAVCDALATAAYNVQEAARSAIEQLPPVVVRVSPITSHLRLVSHLLYGDHSRAVELARLNHLGAKILVDAGDKLLAYSR